jgi:phosphoribosylamine-glycine ligase
MSTCCLDTGIIALGYVCEQMNLYGLTEKAAQMSANKLLMKEALISNNVNTAKHFKIMRYDGLKNALNKLPLPVIVKAVDLQGSKGIYIAYTAEEAFDGFNAVMQETKTNYCIIEEYIEGYEFGAQAFVYNEEILFVLPHGDNTYVSHTAVPIGHFVPLDFTETVLEQTVLQVEQSIKALELNNCAVNVDLILKDNTVYVIELTGRVGATCLPELVSIYYGIDYYKMIAKMAVGEDPKGIFKNKSTSHSANASRMLLSEKEGVVRKLINHNLPNENIFELSFYVSEGDYVNKFVTAKDRIGQVVVKGNSSEECFKNIERILSNIDLVIEN